MTSDTLRWADLIGFKILQAKLSSATGRDRLRAAISTSVAGADAAMIVLGCLISQAIGPTRAPDIAFLNFAVAIGPVFALAGVSLRLYRLSVLRSVLRATIYASVALSLAVAGFLVVALALGQQDIAATGNTVTAFVAIGVLLTFNRIVARSIISALGPSLDPNILVLCDKRAESRDGKARRYLNVDKMGWSVKPNDPHFLAEVYDTVRPYDKVILHFSDMTAAQNWAHVMRLTGIDAELVNPDLQEIAPIGIGAWADNPTLVVSRGALSVGERAVKRAFDLAVVLIFAPVVLPLIGVCALVVKLETSGPAFFVQERIGRNNRRYRCYKLRSMRCDDADPLGNRSTGRNDDRVTRVGKLLRSSSLDEAPQIWNVLQGDMSLVGPRPHALGSTAEGILFWDVVDSYWARHAVKPGITGLAQTRGFRGATHSRADIVARVEADIEYISKWSLWLDVKILLATLRVVLHRNAY